MPYCHALSIKEPLRRLLSEPQRRGEVTKKLPNRQQQASDIQFLSGWSDHGRITAFEPSWENAKHGQQWRNTLETYVYPVFGDKHVRDVDTADVTTAIRPMWSLTRKVVILAIELDRDATRRLIQQRTTASVHLPRLARRYWPEPG